MKTLKAVWAFVDNYGVLIGGILVAIGIFVSNSQYRQDLQSKSPCSEVRHAVQPE